MDKSCLSRWELLSMHNKYFILASIGWMTACAEGQSDPAESAPVHAGEAGSSGGMVGGHAGQHQGIAGEGSQDAASLEDGAASEGGEDGLAGSSGTGGQRPDGGMAGNAGSAGESGLDKCTLDFSPDECDACKTSQCQGACEHCSEQSACLAAVKCIQACSNELCKESCLEQYAGGLDGLLNLMGDDGCLGTRCTLPCGYTCGISWNDSDCDACVNANCYGVCRGCMNERDCYDLLECNAECAGIAACENSCAAAHATGAAKLNTLEFCKTQNCRAQCSP